MYKAALLACAGVVLCAVPASAHSSKLKGTYAFTGSHTCLVAPGKGAAPQTGLYPQAGFNAQLQVNDAPGSNSFETATSVIGIRKFHRNGTGTVKGTSVTVVPRPTPGPANQGIFPSFPPSASSADFSYKFTYTVDDDGGWTSKMIPGTYTSKFTAGPRTGQTVTVDAIPLIAGMMSEDGNTLIGAHLQPTVETHTFSNGDVWPMICGRSRVLIEMKD